MCVGKHVLLAMRDIDENVSLRPGMLRCFYNVFLSCSSWTRLQVCVEPCGFCGLDGCIVQLTKKGNSNTSCKYHYKLEGTVYGMPAPVAVKCTKSAPCTNTWRFQGFPGRASLLSIHSSLQRRVFKLMGIDGILTENWRDEHRIPDTDGIEEMREDLKRARAESSVAGRVWKR